MQTIKDKPFTFDRVVRLALSAILIGASLYLLYILKDVLLPFFIAWLIAYILSPIVRFLRVKLKLANSLAVVVTLLSCAGVFVLLGMLLNPLIKQEIYQINVMITNYELGSLSGANGVARSVQEVINEYVDFNQIRESLSKKSLTEFVQYISPALEKLFSNTISFIFGLMVVFVVLLYLIFILLDYEKINEFWRLLIPSKYKDIVNKVTEDVERNMNTYFRHQALICLILGALYAIGFQLIGLPMAIVFGIFVGAIHMIPYLQVISFPPAILLCWLRASQTDDTFWGMIGLTILIYIIVQCFLDLILTPKIMGKAMGLNPAIILLSLSVWGFFFGIVGMIIAIPLTTLLLSYYKEFLAKAEYLKSEQERIEMQKNEKE